jgi:hypothetical protein
MDWGILAAGLLAFIFSLFGYYSYSVKGLSAASATWSAWHGFFGWFAALAALVGAALVAIELFAPQIKLPVPARLAAAGAFALATLCVILALLVVPAPGGLGSSAINKGHGFSYWLSLIVIIAGLVLSILRLKATGGKLPWEKGGGNNNPPQQWQQGGYPQQ